MNNQVTMKLLITVHGFIDSLRAKRSWCETQLYFITLFGWCCTKSHLSLVNYIPLLSSAILLWDKVSKHRTCDRAYALTCWVKLDCWTFCMLCLAIRWQKVNKANIVKIPATQAGEVRIAQKATCLFFLKNYNWWSCEKCHPEKTPSGATQCTDYRMWPEWMSQSWATWMCIVLAVRNQLPWCVSMVMCVTATALRYRSRYN